MISPISEESFEAICKRWALIITAHESGIQMWPPVSGAEYRIRQFISDKTIQKKLLGSASPRIWLLDFNEKLEISFSDIQQKIAEEIQEASEFNLVRWLSQQTQYTVFFIVGLDHYFLRNNLESLKELVSVINKTQNASILIMTDLNIKDLLIFEELSKQTSFMQNLCYRPYKSHEQTIEDAECFINFLEEDWNIKLQPKMVKQLIYYFSGHLWLLKEAVRLLRNNPTTSLEELLQTPTLIEKAKIIFDMLSENDKKAVLSALHGGKDISFSSYLVETNIIKDNTVNIKYWEYMKNSLEPHSLSDPLSDFALTSSLTASERDVFEMLYDNTRIITREEIARLLWQENWEEKYSDWAIDQLIHRLREKIRLVNPNYLLITKKGEGFFLKK